MGINLKRALKLPFAEKGSLRKVLIPALIIFVIAGIQGTFKSNPVIAIFLSLLLLFLQILINGFVITSAHNEIKNEEIILPDWQMVKLLFTGFCSVLVSLAYGVMLLPVVGIIFAVTMAAKAWALLLVIPATLLLILFSSIPTMMFADELKLGDAFNFSKLFAMIKFGWKDYLILLGWGFVAGLIIGIPTGILSAFLKVTAGKAWAEAVSTVLYNFIMALIAVNLSAQTYKNVTSKLPEIPEEME